MAIIQARSKRKPTGGRYTSTLPKRKYMIGRRPSLTKVGTENAFRVLRTRGGNQKKRLMTVKTANVYDPKTKKHVVAEITTVTENPANRHFVRRNIITKGTVLLTSAGRARVTNRPGQEGMVNAVLIE